MHTVVVKKSREALHELDIGISLRYIKFKKWDIEWCACIKKAKFCVTGREQSIFVLTCMYIRHLKETKNFFFPRDGVSNWKNIYQNVTAFYKWWVYWGYTNKSSFLRACKSKNPLNSI